VASRVNDLAHFPDVVQAKEKMRPLLAQAKTTKETLVDRSYHFAQSKQACP
jgi:hypothetical protein